MSTSDARTATPSPLTPTGFPADESALKRIFDAEFPGALASAKTQLGEAASSAPRVVETSFINTWSKRSTLANQEQFKSLLSDEIRHNSARMLSRRSGARFGSAVSSGKTAEHASTAERETPEYVWAQIDKALHGSGANAEAHSAAVNAGRQERSARMKTMGKRGSWTVPITIVVIALIVSAAGMFYVDRLGEDDAMLELVQAPTVKTVESSTAGQIGTITLGDGTKVRYGPDTKVYVPEGFATKNRVVKIEGTAEFDVAKGQKMPFRVVARHTHFIATGTKFVISTFADDSMPGVLVDEGTVTVKTHKANAAVTAGQAMIADSSGIHPATDDQKAEEFGWASGQITMRNKPLNEVVDGLMRWFNYDVKVPDLPLLDRKASFDVPADSIAMALTQVEKSANLAYVKEADNNVFRDAGAAPKAGEKAAKGTKTKKGGKKK